MDGNYGGTLEARLARADLVIWLDFPRLICLWRVLQRRLRYGGASRPELPPGCPEHLSWDFLAWIWTYPAKRRPGIRRLIDALPPETTVRVLRSPAEVRALAATLCSA